ncbi:MAG: hypothetical protein JWQ81_3672 [Amycolatopsis sp.]|jgi:hypothetical protein|uniref:hypothetical protein n=1 Tax=Amycolatopsis sp. TaxID=37632 RepID=UPI002613EB90|nr:hypothetical protein [Amycolatopsis sp.]MCU1682933.1 hypothetical protein [Amycolatopsis sp.]
MEMAKRDFSPNPGDTLLFENDRVRVWSMTLGPHEEFAFHEHHHDHVIIWPWSGSVQGQQYLPQEYGEGKWGMAQHAEPGFVMAKTVGTDRPLTPHRVRNLRDETVEHFIIELLEASPSSTEQPWQHNGRGDFSVDGAADS